MNRLSEIRQRLDAATPGPWRWGGYVNGPIFLQTPDRGRLTVMDFVRQGMHGAQPRFRRYDRMDKAADFAERQVPYRDDVGRMNHPDADLIANAPSDLRDLLAFVDDVAAALAHLDAREVRR